MKYINLILLFISVVGNSQTKETVILSNSDPHDLYRSNDKDSSSLFYRLIIPKTKPVGALVILSGAGKPIDYTADQIKLHTLAADKGLLVIFPSINQISTKQLHEHEMLNKIFTQVIKRFGIPKDKFVLGGFSGGAMLSLSYAEKANKEKGVLL